MNELRQVACQGCGASLDVGPTTQFVTCNYCNARLSVEVSASSTFTKVLDAIEKRTARLEEKLDAAEDRDALEALDRNWKAERRRFLLRRKDGSKTEPSVSIGVAVIAVGLLGGAIFAQIAGGHGADEMALFGLLFALGGVGIGVHTIVQAKRFETARMLYEGEREAILDHHRDRRQR